MKLDSAQFLFFAFQLPFRDSTFLGSGAVCANLTFNSLFGIPTEYRGAKTDLKVTFNSLFGILVPRARRAR